MSTLSTKNKILNSAEQLVAELGFGNVSVRQICQRAETNISAINYHFGNKQRLLQEMIQRRLDNLFALRERMLEELDTSAQNECVLEQILHAFIAPALTMSTDQHQGGKTFMRVLARAYAEQSQFLHELMSERYTRIIKKFAAAIHRSRADLDPQTLFWRFHFLIGSLTYVMGDFGASAKMSSMDESDYFNTCIQELTDFAVASLTG